MKKLGLPEKLANRIHEARIPKEPRRLPAQLGELVEMRANTVLEVPRSDGKALAVRFNVGRLPSDLLAHSVKVAVVEAYPSELRLSIGGKTYSVRDDRDISYLHLDLVSRDDGLRVMLGGARFLPQELQPEVPVDGALPKLFEGPSAEKRERYLEAREELLQKQQAHRALQQATGARSPIATSEEPTE